MASSVPEPSPRNTAPAKTFPFELDLFQKTAIGYIDKNESVLVAAHTSAGKTSVAEYAIALALREKQRVIYTSPIKALSNQKFREFQQEFGDVGLMTGDVTIDPNASCLVMTTEILRSMLYKGSEVMKEVAFVVFDEVHYLRDSERGVVWEESIILLPHRVRFIFLSATIPNAQEFVDWVSKIHSQPCHVVYTDYRPTPLQHWLYCSGGEEVFPVVNEKGKFNEDVFQKAMGTFELAIADEDAGRKKQKSGGKPADLERIMRLILSRDYAPVIVFSFSKKDCEAFALQISRTGITLTSDRDKEMIGKVYENAIAGLSEEDKALPAVQSLLPLLKNGIGIHHGGLLPILKEVVEILFGENLLKCLFATETFAIGINMPAKTVVFTSHKKFDGQEFRSIRSGEYIQMSGRAGRRGKDLRGIVMLMVDAKMELETAKELMSGKADALTSSFHLGYNMVLNLLRVEDADPEYIVKNSFYVYQREAQIPDLVRRIQELELAKQLCEDERVVQYHRLGTQLAKTKLEIRSRLRNADKLKPFLSSAGRLIKVDEYGWGVVLGMQQGSVVDCLLCCHPFKDVPAPSRSELEFRSVAVSLSAVDELSSVVLNLPHKDLKPLEARTKALHLVREVQSRLKNVVPVLGWKEMKMEPVPQDLVETQQELEQAIAAHPLHAHPKLAALLEQRTAQLKIEHEQQQIEKKIKTIKTLPLKDELRRMKQVLRRLGHLDAGDVVQLKGRVACEVSTADELLVVELLFAGVFNELDAATCAALASVLVFAEGGSAAANGEGPKASLKPHLAASYKLLQQCARRIGEVKRDAEEEIDVEQYVESFQCDLMEVVEMWCRGSKFKQLADSTAVMEGTIVRTVRREVELLRQMCSACKVIGDNSLELKFQSAIQLMQRDIMFAASLYL